MKNELNVPEPYQKLMELSICKQNRIFFCGFNEYAFRNLLTKIASVEEMRKIFMLSLKFAQAESYKFKVNYRHNDSK